MNKVSWNVLMLPSLQPPAPRYQSVRRGSSGLWELEGAERVPSVQVSPYVIFPVVFRDCTSFRGQTSSSSPIRALGT